MTKEKLKELINTIYRLIDGRPEMLLRLISFPVFLLGIIPVAVNQETVSQRADEILMLSPIFKTGMKHFLLTYLLLGGAGLLFLCFYPIGKRRYQEELKSAGFANHDGLAPELKRRSRDRDNPRVTVWEFKTQNIPLPVWEDRQAVLEATLGVTILKMRYVRGKSRIQLYAVSAIDDLPDFLPWEDSYLSEKSFELVLGQGYSSQVKVNLAHIPHILLGGATGSGKSVLLEVLLLQAVKKGAKVAIADFKGGVDFPLTWREQCKFCCEEQSLLELLDSYVDILQKRKELFGRLGIPNLDEYNKATHRKESRYILACDEIAEVLDKTGLTKEQKEVVGQIESRLAIIARLGRAFGNHLILATQRPDANILSGQIRNNINCRVCGRADNVLSQIILDNADAAEQIPKDARGRFLLHDGTVFQGFWLDDTKLGGGAIRF